MSRLKYSDIILPGWPTAVDGLGDLLVFCMTFVNTPRVVGPAGERIHGYLIGRV